MALVTRALVGSYEKADGTPAAGHVTFTPNASLTSGAENTLIPVSVISETLDAAGAFSVTLLCTDDATVSPPGWAYTVVEQITGIPRRTYAIEVPTGGSPLDLADATVVEDAPATTSYLVRANNLSDLTSTTTARTNLGLGNSATRAVGTTAGTVAAGDDSRFADKLPLAGGTVSGDLTVSGIFTALGYAGFGGNIGLGSGVSQIGFYNATPVSKPTVTGDRGNPAGAIADLLAELAALGLITNSTTASVMSPVYVAPASATLPGDLPAGLPAGTVVLQLDS